MKEGVKVLKNRVDALDIVLKGIDSNICRMNDDIAVMEKGLTLAKKAVSDEIQKGAEVLNEINSIRKSISKLEGVSSSILYIHVPSTVWEDMAKRIPPSEIHRDDSEGTVFDPTDYFMLMGSDYTRYCFVRSKEDKK